MQPGGPTQLSSELELLQEKITLFNSLECSVCLHNTTCTLVKCGHFLCRTCLSGILNARTLRQQCPECREPFPPMGPALQDNHGLIRKLRELEGLCNSVEKLASDHGGITLRHVCKYCSLVVKNGHECPKVPTLCQGCYMTVLSGDLDVHKASLCLARPVQIAGLNVGLNVLDAVMAYIGNPAYREKEIVGLEKIISERPARQ